MKQQIEYIERSSGKMMIEVPPGEFFLKFLYHHPFGSLPLNLLVKRKFTSSIYGFIMNLPFSKGMIEEFVKINNIEMDEFRRKITEYKSFNDFFHRKLKAGVRTISPNLNSPADGRLIAFQNINENSSFFIKGSKFSLSDFLQNKKLAEKYKNGTMVIIRLAPADYHRLHFPASGKIGVSKIIKGFYFSVSPLAMKKSLEIFCQNQREYSILESEKYGNILYSEIGATMVGSIIQTYTPNSHVKGGDEKGYFAFGGSSVLILLEKGKIKIDSDILKNTNNGYETLVKMGEQIGS